MMKKTDLIDDLSEHFDLSKTNARTAVELILQEITQSISKQGVEVRGFGGFHKKYRKVRQGINPKTNKQIQIKAKFVPFFKAGKSLKETVDTA